MEEKTIKEIADRILKGSIVPENGELRFVIHTNTRANPGTRTYVPVKGILVINKKESFIIESENGNKWKEDTLCIASEVYKLIYSDK